MRVILCVCVSVSMSVYVQLFISLYLCICESMYVESHSAACVALVSLVGAGDQVKLLFCEAVPSAVGKYHVLNLRTKEEGKVSLDAVDFVEEGELAGVCVWVWVCV